ncbi:hypothetical protein [Streptomyces sp. NRRL S-1824]|uniref:hypothetical protein n=1 Tax=Streptomyces sp. NRRL S-1824 TaxID=1463889 RepID=UPI00068A3671|nr:hypothetical protein [Streptomyces sp. NRRL S-1824]
MGAWGGAQLEPLADEAGGVVLRDAAPHAGTPSEAEALAVRLGGLPLALNAAGSYLSASTSRHRTFTAYQRALDVEFGDLIGAVHPGAAGDPEIARQVVRHTPGTFRWTSCTGTATPSRARFSSSSPSWNPRRSPAL